MAVLKLDPPPATDDVRVLQGWMQDMYDAVNNLVYNLDEDNFNDEFLEKIGGGSA